MSSQLRIDRSSVESSSGDYTITTPDQCFNATMSIGIAIFNINYNNTNVKLPTSTCVTIILTNFDTNSHTFTIDASNSDNISYFNIYVQGWSHDSRNFLTPSVYSQLFYYCSVPGHKQNNQFGTMVVGQKPSFSIPL